MVDVESAGSITGDYSMISFGPVLVTPALDKTHDRGQFRRSGVRGTCAGEVAIYAQGNFGLSAADQ